MSRESKEQAQERVDRIHAFRAELDELRAEGVLELTEEQRERLEAHHEAALQTLAARYDVDTTESQKQISWGMRIASTAAGFALCAAVCLFFYRIWGSLAVPVQVGLLIAVPLVSILAMEFSSRRERTYYYTALLGIVAFAAAVLNLSALGSMFNLTGSPYAFLVWAAFGVGLASAYRLRLLLAAGLVCGILFVTMMLSQSAGLYWAAALDTRPEGMVAGGLLVAAIPLALRGRGPEEFTWVYAVVGLFAVLLGSFVLSSSGNLTYLPLGRAAAEVLYELAGFLVAGLAMWRGVRGGSAGLLVLGAGFFLLFLVERLVEWWWDWMPKYLFFLIVSLISLGFLYAFQRMRRRQA